MKLIVFSDSHGNTTHMCEIIDRERPDQVLHLGDVVRDAQEVERRYPQIPMVYVAGNCDGNTKVPPTKLITVAGRHILMTHGHPYNVKLGMGAAIHGAKEAGAHILLFGHTHQDYYDCVDGLWVMNPGSIRGLGPATFGVITMEKDDVLCYTLPLD